MGSAEATMPLLIYNKQFLPVKGNIEMREIPFFSTQSISMACYNDVTVEIVKFQPFDSDCSGKHCNKAQLYSNGRVKNTCACFQMCRRSSSPGIAWSFKLTTRGGQEITADNFSSHRFLFDWILRTVLSPKARASHLDDFDANDAIMA